MSYLTLSKRPGTIGPSINTRTKMHGDDSVPGVDIPIQNILLDAGELGVLMNEPTAHERLFRTDRSKHAEPAFMNVKPMVIDGKFEDAKVTIFREGADPLILKPAKVASIKLTPQVGGLTAMTCTVQGNPTDHVDVLELLNAKIRVSILNGKVFEADQSETELPLGPGGTGAEESPKRGRKSRTRADIDG